MSFAARHNKVNVFDVNTEGFVYYGLGDLYDGKDPEKVFPIRGFYINHKSKYGDAPVAILEDKFANLPAFMLDEVLAIMVNEEDIADIKAGKVGFVIEPYFTDNRPGEVCYAVRWADC